MEMSFFKKQTSWGAFVPRFVSVSFRFRSFGCLTSANPAKRTATQVAPFIPPCHECTNMHKDDFFSSHVCTHALRYTDEITLPFLVRPLLQWQTQSLLQTLKRYGTFVGCQPCYT